MKYDFEWSISDDGWSITGKTTIEAENHDEATAKFDQLSNRDLIEAVTDMAAGNDTRELLDGPTSDEDRARDAQEQREAWERVRLYHAEKRALDMRDVEKQLKQE
jgi:hypothetical protein